MSLPQNKRMKLTRRRGKGGELGEGWRHGYAVSGEGPRVLGRLAAYPRCSADRVVGLSAMERRSRVTRRAWLLVAAVAAVALVGVTFQWAMRGIVIRQARPDALAERYVGDLARAQERAAAGIAVSEDGRFAAFDTAAARSYYTINVWDRWSEKVTAVLSVQEADPGSGPSHAFA
jgi:hypothetical protein